MNEIAISLCASANRHTLANGFKNWERFMNSLKGNKINYEVIFVGDSKCPYPLPSNFKWIYANVKPAQCYQIAFWEAKGETILWVADDCNFNNPKLNCPNSLDIAHNFYKMCEKKYNDKKTIVALNPCEDGGWPQERWHYYYGGIPTYLNSGSKMMAPFGLIDRDYFLDELGGYDYRFWSGQSENDVCMRVYEDGGRIEFCKNASLYVHHSQVHPRKNGKEDNKFRMFYNEDRKFLENCWTVGGYGFYEKMPPEKLAKIVKISNKRIIPFEGFKKTADVTTATQGPKGIW